MSVEAIVWALKLAPDVSGREQVVLIGLADHADANGTGAYPSWATLANYARCTVRTVGRSIESLEGKQLIERGDQLLVIHLPPDRRPVVWNLRLDRVRDRQDGRGEQEQRHVTTDTPSTKRDDTSDTPSPERHDTDDRTACHPRPNDMTPVTERHDADVIQTALEPSLNRPEPKAARATVNPTVSFEARKLVRENISPELPDDVKKSLARIVGKLLDDGTAPRDIVTGLMSWQGRVGAGPGLLPHLVGDAVKARTAPPPMSTSDQRVHIALAQRRPEWDDEPDPAHARPAIGLAAKFNSQKAIPS
ncbi:helix-turn-helix domain-containing protein [Nocardia sp. NPDC004415]